MFFLFRNIVSWMVRPLKRLSGRFFASQKINQTRVTINLLQEQIRQTYFQIHRLGIIRVVGSVIGIIILQAIPVSAIMAIDVASNTNAEEVSIGLTERELQFEQIDYAATDTPTFHVEVGQKSMIPFLNIDTERRSIESMTLTTPTGAEVALALEPTSTNQDGRSVMQRYAIPEVYGATPGEYQIAVTTNENGTILTATRQFYWGVVVLNTDQDVYRPGDTAIINLGAVDAKGNTVCDADIELRVTAPSGDAMVYSTSDGSVERSAECGPNSVTHIPDYRARVPVSELGAYQIGVQAVYQGAEHNLIQTFSVRDDAAYTIRRVGPSRIWPVSEYHMTLSVIPRADYRGTVTEPFQSGFDITSISADGARTGDGDSPAITWAVDWQAGQTYHLTYTFNAPDISPALFTLGPVSIGEYTEGRQWQIASDATLVYVGGAEASGNSASFNISLTGLTGGIGSAAIEGDMVIVSTGFVKGNIGTDQNPGVSTSGFAEVADTWANDTREGHLSVNWKIMTSTPDTTVACNGSGLSTDGAVAVVHVWRGANQATPLNPTTTSTTGTNASNPNSPSITPSTAGSVIISTGLGTMAAVDNAVTAPTSPNTFVNQVDISVDPGNAATIGISSYSGWSSGAYDTGAWTNFTTTTSDGWGAAALVIQPSSSVMVSGTSNLSSGTVAAAVNGTRQTDTGAISGGNWVVYLNTAPSGGDTITVWVDAATDANESTGVTNYTAGDVTGMVLNQNVMTIGSSENTSVTVTNLGQYDYDSGSDSGDEDVMHTANASVLDVEGSANSYSDETINVLASNTLTISGTESLTTDNVSIAGTLTSGGNSTYTISGNWTNAGTFTASTSTVTFNDSAAQTITSGGSSFNNITFNNSSASDPNINYTGALTIGANVTLSNATRIASTNNTALVISGTINGANVISINAGSGTVTFGGIIGGSTPITSLTSSGSGAVTINTTGITTRDVASNNVSFTGAVTLGGGLTIITNNATNDGTITFSSTINGAQTLALDNGAGAVTLGGIIGGSTPITSLSVTGTGTITINTTAITTRDVASNNVSFTGAVTLGGGLTVDTNNTTNDGAITFSSTINGAQTLTLDNGAGVVVLNGIIGGSTPITSLTVSGTGAITTDGSGITTRDVASNNVSFAGPLTLNSPLSISTDNTTNDGTITFSGTVNSQTAENNALTLNAGSSAVTCSGNVGATQSLGLVTKQGSGDLTFGAVSLAATGLTLSAGTINNAGTDSGTWTISSDITMVSGTLTVTSAVTIGGILNQDGGTLNINTGANVDIAIGTTAGVLFDVDGGTVNLNNGSIDSGAEISFVGNTTVNLNGGAHHAGASGSGANGTITLNNLSGDLTFNMIGGSNPDAGGCNLTSSNFNVYGTGNLVTTTVTGGTICMGTTHATRNLYDVETNDHSFYNFKILENAQMNPSTSEIIKLKGSFTINSGKTFDAQDNTMWVDNGWVNNGSFTSGTSTVILRGGNVSGSADTTFNNLTIGDGTTNNTVTLTGTDDPIVTNTMNVDSGDTFSIGASRTTTLNTTASLTLSGTISGAGKLIYKPAAAFPTGGTISSTLQFDSSSNDQIMSARTYGGTVESRNDGVAIFRTLTMGTAGGQTINITGSLTVYDNFAGMSVDASTYDPDVNITGDLGPCTMFDGTPGFAADAGTWTVTGNVTMTLCWGSSFSGSHTLLMNGSTKTLTSSLTSWHNLTITGSITLANGNHTIGGNVVLTGSTITPGTSTVNMVGASMAITGGGQTLNNLTINPSVAGTITAQTSDFTVGGTLNVAVGDAFTINSGITVTHTGVTLTLTGTINGPGRLTYRSATAFPTGGILASGLILRMDATSTNQSLGARTDYQKVEIDNSGTTAGRIVYAGTAGSQTLTINSTLDLINTGTGSSTTIFNVNNWDPTLTVTGSVTIAADSTFEASSATTTNFGDDFSNSGTFNANAGTIALTTSTAATIAGSTTFQNLSVTGIGAAKTINFTNGTTQTVSGTWTVTGAAGQLVTLQSTSLGNQWTINPTAASVSYVDVNDSNNTGVAFCATFSQSTNDNNTNWQIGTGATCGIDVSGTSNSSGGTVRVAVNSSEQAQTTTLAATWTISGVTVNNTDIVTVYVEAADTAETTGVAQYDGTGNIGGMVLDTNVLSIGSDDNQTIDLTDLDLYSCADNENVMHSVASGVLDVEGTDAGCGANPANSFTDETMTVTASDTLSIGNAQTMNTHNVTVNTSGILTSGTTGVFSVSGSWDNNGTFTASTSTVTFNSGSTETVEAGSSSFNVVEFANAAGTWTVQTNNLTTASNLTLTSGTFTLETGRTLEVQGNYAQAIAAANTTWTGSTLYLNGSGGMYDINTKTHGGDTYATLRVGATEDIAVWDSSAGTYTIDSGGCLFSEDHGATAGRLNIYGTCNSRANEYWSYATDFDGAAVTRQADVRFAPSATLTVDNGDTLAILGQNAGANRTIVTRESTGNYGVDIDGTLNAQYFDFDYLDANGLRLASHTVVTELSDGSFDNNAAGASSSYITLTNVTTTQSLFRIVFDESSDGADVNVVYNINADGSGIDWTMLQWSGAKGGEANDNEANSASVKWFSDLTLAVSANAIDLGVVNPLITGSGNHTITVTSNAQNGYTCRAVEDGNLRNGASDIDDVIDGTVTTGNEEYGVSCTGADCQLTGDNAMTGSPLTIATYNATAVARVTTLYYKAAISSATVGLPYSHVVTITCTGDF